MAFPIDTVGFTANYVIPKSWIGMTPWYDEYYTAVDIIDTQMKLNADNIAQNVTDISALDASFLNHSVRHEVSGADEISLSGLAGTNIVLDSLLVDSIVEKTTDNGVDLETIHFEDGRITGLSSPVATDEPATKLYVDTIIAGLDPQESVIDKDLVTSPAPAIGARYIIAGIGGAWSTGTVNDITECTGVAPETWDFITPDDGMFLFVEDENLFYFYDGDTSSWKKFGSIVSHNGLAGLQGGTAGEYYHLKSLQHDIFDAVGNLGLADDKVLNFGAIPDASIGWNDTDVNLDITLITAGSNFRILKSTSPNMVLVNTTDTNNAYPTGRGSAFYFDGLRATEAIYNSLAKISAGHDGVGDDYYGKLVIGTNDGGGIVDAITIDRSQNVILTQNVYLEDSKRIYFGNDDDVSIYWDNVTGFLWLDTGTNEIYMGEPSGQRTYMGVDSTLNSEFIQLGVSSDDIIWNEVKITQASTIMNVYGDDCDTIIRGDGISNLFYVDAGLDAIGIGAAPAGSDLMQIGDGTNFSAFESNGMLEFNGTAVVWDDIYITGIALGTVASAPDKISFLGAGNLKVYGFDGGATTEMLHGTFELKHGWKEGTDISVHVHWTPTDANAGNVKWQLEYTWIDVTGVFGASTTISIIDATDTTAWKHLKVSFSNIVGAGKTIGSVVVFRLFRDPADGSDTYGSDAALVDIGCHFQVDTVGSRSMLTK